AAAITTPPERPFGSLASQRPAGHNGVKKRCLPEVNEHSEQSSNAAGLRPLPSLYPPLTAPDLARPRLGSSGKPPVSRQGDRSCARPSPPCCSPPACRASPWPCPKAPPASTAPAARPCMANTAATACE